MTSALFSTSKKLLFSTSPSKAVVIHAIISTTQKISFILDFEHGFGL